MRQLRGVWGGGGSGTCVEFEQCAATHCCVAEVEQETGMMQQLVMSYNAITFTELHSERGASVMAV